MDGGEKWAGTQRVKLLRHNSKPSSRWDGEWLTGCHVTFHFLEIYNLFQPCTAVNKTQKWDIFHVWHFNPSPTGSVHLMNKEEIFLLSSFHWTFITESSIWDKNIVVNLGLQRLFGCLHGNSNSFLTWGGQGTAQRATPPCAAGRAAFGGKSRYSMRESLLFHQLCPYGAVSL